MLTGRSLKVGQVYRYGRPYDSTNETVNGMLNYFYFTHTAKQKFPLLEKGINSISTIKLDLGSRLPAILISSSPHKSGSLDVPWRDYFDLKHGYIKYFGDNKSEKTDPALASGNKALLNQFRFHSSNDENIKALSCPIIFFKRITYQGRPKGNVQFFGYGVIEKAFPVTQERLDGLPSFKNFEYKFRILSKEDEEFNWDWISTRRDVTLTNDQILKLAPESWLNWIKS